MITKVVIQKNQYRDSVFLMVINDRVRAVSGIEEVAVMMGTENNKGILQESWVLGASDPFCDCE